MRISVCPIFYIEKSLLLGGINRCFGNKSKSIPHTVLCCAGCFLDRVGIRNYKLILTDWLTVSDGNLFNLNCINFFLPNLEVIPGKGFWSFPFEFSSREYVKFNSSIWDKWILKMFLQTVSDISCICYLERGKQLSPEKKYRSVWLHAKCMKTQKTVCFISLILSS